jgi:hypothetical protein
MFEGAHPKKRRKYMLDDVLRLADDVFRMGNPVAILGFLLLVVIVILATAYSNASEGTPQWTKIIIALAVIGGLIYFLNR